MSEQVDIRSQDRLVTDLDFWQSAVRMRLAAKGGEANSWRVRRLARQERQRLRREVSAAVGAVATVTKPDGSTAEIGFAYAGQSKTTQSVGLGEVFVDFHRVTWPDSTVSASLAITALGGFEPTAPYEEQDIYGTIQPTLQATADGRYEPSPPFDPRVSHRMNEVVTVGDAIVRLDEIFFPLRAAEGPPPEAFGPASNS